MQNSLFKNFLQSLSIKVIFSFMVFIFILNLHSTNGYTRELIQRWEETSRSSSYRTDDSSTITISSLQLSKDSSDSQVLFQKVQTFIQNATSDIVVLPEMYIPSPIINGESVISKFQKLASETGVCIVATYQNSSQVSSLVIIDSKGQIVTTYSKQIQEGFSTSGNDFSVGVLSTRRNVQIKVGGILGTDISFPETTTILMTMGVELIVAPLSLTITDVILNQIRTRSFENAAVIIATNEASYKGRNTNGNSAAFSWCASPSTSSPGCSKGTPLLFQAGLEEGIYTAQFQLSDLHNFRQNYTIWGDSFRRPYYYQPLCGINSPSLEPLVIDKNWIPQPENEEETLFVNQENNQKSLDDSLTIKVALLQMNADNITKEGNQKIAEQYCRQAAKLGADVALMPEMFSVGYDALYKPYNNSNPKATFNYLNNAVSVNSAYVQFFRNLAVELNIAIGVTFLERWNGPPRNTITLIDRFGKILYSYAKIHTCDFTDVEAITSPGYQFYTNVLNTVKGNVIVGSIICYDREHFESARIVVTAGEAELILIPNACYIYPEIYFQLSSRAAENVVAIAMANYPSPQQNGNSVVFDHLGNNLLTAGHAEGVYLADIDIGSLRQFRLTKEGQIHLHPKPHQNLCALSRNPQFTVQNVFRRVSGSTI